MTTIIALSGKTSSGKDSAAKFVKDKYEIEPIVSYTTRPIRCNELNGREHYFVNDEEMDKIVADKDSLLAFVQFPKTGYRYCVSTKDISDGTIKTYIIDPIGLKWLRENRPDVKVISIFFELSEDIIKERALKRGDNIDAIEKRLDSEREMFDEFARNQEYDVRIDTNDTPEAVNNAIAAALKLFGIE